VVSQEYWLIEGRVFPRAGWDTRALHFLAREAGFSLAEAREYLDSLPVRVIDFTRM